MKTAIKRIGAIFVVFALCFCVVFEASAAGYPDYYPNTHRNTGSHIADLIGVAKTQLGYTELDSSGNPIPSSSDGGYTKYGDSFGEPRGAWCAYFISWCASQAAIPSSIVPRLGNCGTLTDWYQSRSIYYSRSSGYIPKPGDMVFFNWSGGTSAQHIGIVTGVSGNNLYTIEGNTGGDEGYMCNGRTRSLNASYVLGYGVPNYNDASTYVGSYSFAASVSSAGASRSDSTVYSSGNLSVVTTSATNITCTDATLNGSVKNLTGQYISAAGFYFGADKNKLEKFSVMSGASQSNFDLSMNVAKKYGKLTPNTTYYYRAYVTINGNLFTGPMYAVVTVNDQPQQLVLSAASVNVGVGQTAEIMWAQLPVGSTDKGVTWTSENPDIAVIGNDGIITGVGYGKVTLTATTNFGSAFSSVDVNVLIGKPQNIKLTNISKNEIGLSWDKVEKAKGYIIYRCESSDGKYKELKKLDGNVTSFVDKDVKEGQRYYYKLKTLAKDEKYDSDITDVMYITAKLPAPTVKKAQNDENGFGKLSWNKVGGAEKYVIYRSRAKEGVYVAISDVRGTDFTDFSANLQGEYYYKVVAVASNEKATSSFSDIAEIKILGAYADSDDIETVKTIERQSEKTFDELNVFKTKTGIINFTV